MFSDNSTTKSRQSVKVGTKIIGYFEGNKFIKPVTATKHKLRSPSGWAIDAQAWDSEIKPNANEFIIIDKETSFEYHCSIDEFERCKGELDRGFGKQYFATDSHWQIINPTCFQLSLFGGTSL